jgi:hypothetical protein
VDIRRTGMGGVGGILREPKSMLIEPPWSIFYKATIFATFLLVIAHYRDSLAVFRSCPGRTCFFLLNLVL